MSWKEGGRFEENPSAASAGGRELRSEGLGSVEGLAWSEVSRPYPPRPPAEIAAGTRYVEGGELGRGGMGRVLVGFDPALARTVALKRAKDNSPETEAQLIAEARVTASLDHPGIISVLDVGRGGDGALFYAMRVVEGVSFGDAVRAAGRSLAERVRLTLAVVQAMAYAHARGIVHRDLSVSNVRVGAHGEVVVMDWGLATTAQEAARGGLRCGTPGFQAPELAAGRAAGPSADVYSLGALLHLAVTGTLPATGTRRPRRCPRELWSVVVKALSAEASQRYADAGALEADLKAWLDGRPVGAAPPTPWGPVLRLVRRHPSGAAVAGVASLIVAGVAIVLGLRAEEARLAAVEASRRLFVQAARDATLADDVAGARLALAQLGSLDSTFPEAVGLRAAFARAAPAKKAPLALPSDCLVLDWREGEALCRRDDSLVVLHAGRAPAVQPWGLDVRRLEQARLLADGHVLLYGLFGQQHQLVLVTVGDARPVATLELGGGLQTLRPTADGAGILAALVTHIVFADPSGLRARAVCSPSAPARFALPGRARDEAWVLCGSQLVHVTSSGLRNVGAGLERTAARGAFRADAVDQDHLVIGTVEGQVALFDLRAERLARVVPSVVGPVDEVRVVPGTPFVVVNGRDGLGWWRFELSTWTHVERGHFDDVRVFDGALVHREAGTWWRWQPPAVGPWHAAGFEAGLTSVAWAPDGRSLAVGDAESRVRLIDVETGATRVFSRADGGVVTGVTFSPDGRYLAWSTAGPWGVDVIDLSSGQLVTGPWREEAFRARAIGFHRGTLAAIDYGGRLRRFSVAEATESLPVQLPGPHVAAAAMQDLVLAVLMKDGQLFVLEGDTLAARGRHPGATALAITPSAELVVGDAEGLERRDPVSGAVLEQRRLPGSAVLAIAAGEADRWVVARLTGQVEVSGGSGLLLQVAAHRSRAASVAWAPDGRRFASAGWDGVVRLLEWPPPAR
jgi:WD40 repeat protein